MKGDLEESQPIICSACGEEIVRDEETGRLRCGCPQQAIQPKARVNSLAMSEDSYHMQMGTY